MTSQVQAADSEAWVRGTGEPDIRGVSVTRIEESGGWQVTVAAAGFMREDPLKAELRERIRTGLYAVDGVTAVEEDDREAWLVAGAGSGHDLARRPPTPWTRSPTRYASA